MSTSITQERKPNLVVNNITVTKIEKIISSNEKKVIYDFGEDLTEYRYLVEDWRKKYGGGWQRLRMYWPENHQMAKRVL